MVFRSLSLILVGVSISTSLQYAFAEGESEKGVGVGRPALTGEVAYTDTQSKPPDAQAIGLTQVEAWSGRLQEIVKRDGTGDLPALGEAGSNYLPVLYLYCVAKKGPCPFVLDVILEADTVIARGVGEARCPTMSKFWRSWSENSFDERIKFLTSLTDGLAVAEFNTTSRPRYVLCKKTVQAILDNKGEIAGRYGENGSARKGLESFATYLKGIKDANTDIFAVAR
jgi:hypothetical protein